MAAKRAKGKPSAASEKTDRQAEHIEEQETPPAPVIYDSVRMHGEEEMSRPATSLWWSGVAAGLSISFSLLSESILRMHLPDAPWRELVTSLGFPVGFLIVVLGRQQLFTENTITVVLPVMASPTRRNFARAGRMWGIVLAANLVGAFLAALFCAFAPVIEPQLRSTMLDVSREAMQHGWVEMGFRGITSGFLIATMVWLIPSAGPAQFHVVALMTYLVGVGGFAHIVTGSLEAFLLLVTGELGFLAMLGGFTLPVLVGNIVGGTVLFALLAHVQVMREI
jgi:formate-nitrite transporter family protein